MILVYDNPDSGNSYKVRLLLTQLHLPFRIESVSVVGDRSEATRAELFEHNPIGKIPTVVLEDGTALGESAAILWYFAEGTPYLPDDKLERARVLQWMTFEQNSHEPNIAVARHQLTLETETPADDIVAGWHAGGHRALRIMDSHLSAHDYFVAGRYTIADIALFAYTQVAPEGGFDLEPYPAVRAWLDRVRAQPDHIPMAT